MASSLPASGKPCTSCGLCASVCPVRAISMREQKNGFLRPEVDADICIHCHACEKACAKLASPLGNVEGGMQAYEAWADDTDLRAASSSGGVFSVLAKAVLAQGGVVYGVEMPTRDTARFIAVEKEEDLPRLRGSKYLQADPGYCYREIRDLLKQGREVLFSGTPCQVRALRSLVGRRYGNLLAVDVACYGVPSRLLLRSMICAMEQGGGKVLRYVFRDKTEAWRGSRSRVDFVDAPSRVLTPEENPFLQGFLSTYALNESCYACGLSLQERSGDLSLGDFWGRCERDDEADRRGVSVLVCRTEKGRRALETVAPRLHLRPVDMELAASENGGMVPQNRPVPACRQAFLKEIAEAPLDKVMRRYQSRGIRLRPYIMLGKRPLFLPRVLYRLYEIAYGLRCRLLKRWE